MTGERSGTGPGGPQDSSPGAGRPKENATGFVWSSTTLPVLPPKDELRLLAKLTPDVQLRQGLDGRWIGASPSSEVVLGYEPAELEGRAALELVHPADRADVARTLRAGLAVSDTLSLRLRLIREDGSLLRADVRFDAVRDADGAIAEHHVTVRDASDRRRSDELRAQWEVLFRLTRRGIAVTDPRSQVLVAVNPAYAAMHGGEVEDFVGLPVACVLAPGSAERLDSLGEEIDEQGFLSYDSEHVRTDGSVFPAAVDMMAARDEDGQQLYWLAWVEDLTERRRSEEAAARHAGELARSNADLDRFAGVVSHDLQSPLRVIAGCARILERRMSGQLDPEQRELLDHLVGGVHRMSALLDGIREYSRVRAGEDELAVVDCRAVVDGVLASLAADLEAAGAEVRVGALPRLPAHAVQLAQLFQNLIANAVKFRAEEPPVIAISARPGEAIWEFTVTDNGIGIDPEYAERVFDFGQRLHRDDEVPGSGIGLTVCKTVVERHHGRIWVEPAPGGGSRFHFTLPTSSA
jgi:PAS domain S-box-containing protein